MILIDHRESRSIVPQELKNFKIPIKFTTLEVGDYLVCGTEEVCVSRKECNDYVGSLTSGHLNNELYDMSTQYAYSIFVFEGTVSNALMHSKLHRQSYYSSLVGTALERSAEGKSGVINFLPGETPYDTALILKYIHERVTKEGGLLRTPVLNLVRWQPKDRQIGILSAFPKIGKIKAMAILKDFKTLNMIANASVEDLCTVPGIGPIIANAMYDMWRREV